MHIVICDDEKIICELIGDKVRKQFPYAVVDFYSSGDELTEEKYMMINNGGVHIKVNIDDIVYAEVFNRKVVIHKLNETIEYYGSIHISLS